MQAAIKLMIFFCLSVYRGGEQIVTMPGTIKQIVGPEKLRPVWAWYLIPLLTLSCVIEYLKVLTKHGFMWGDLVFYLFALGVQLPIYGMLAEWLFKKGGIVGWCPGLPLNFRDTSGKEVVRGSEIADGEHAARGAEGWANELNLYVGGVPIPYGVEAQHFLIAGRTGAGKTVVISEMLETAYKRGNPALVADPGAGYYGRFGRDADILLNPFDRRSVGWSPFAEIDQPYDCQRLARAAIPDGSGESREWQMYAQTLLSEVLRKMWEAGETSVKDLMWWLTVATADELAIKLAGSPAAILTQQGNAKMLGNVRGIISTYLNAWQFLPEFGTFSVRQWMRTAALHLGPSLYLTYRDDQLAVLRQLLACWIELAVVEGLSLPEDPQRRVWIVVDELDSLGRVTALRDGLTKLRKYGVPVVAGLQTVAQLRDTYGRDLAQVLLSCLSTKIILAAGDGETGKYFEDELGQREAVQNSFTEGKSAQFLELPHLSESRTRSQSVESAVLASEIQGLPNLHGFLRVVGWPILRVALAYKSRENVREPFQG